ncbi:YeiH family protein [Geobacillus sp. G4]|uniref:YeiH family protein n=1 Tax=Geobacillus sp. G4 TaxID=3169691 RepID=UPI00333BDDC2
MQLSNPKEKAVRQPIFMHDKLAHCKGYVQGIALTLVLALLANNISKLPFFSIMGVMILSIVMGAVWNVLMPVPANAERGISFSSKILLRLGIILMGFRLDFAKIIDMGASVFLIDGTVILFTLVVIAYLGKWFKIDRHLSLLLAVGTAICGAAAIVAVAPLIHARREITAVSVAFIAVLGTVGTIIYTWLYPLMDFNQYQYGVFAGATLHELAHVIAAASAGGDLSLDTAIVMKLGRVALLIPVALVLGYLFSRNGEHQTEKTKLPIPWFIFGFLICSVIQTTGVIPAGLTDALIALSVLCLSMAMAGLGLSINFRTIVELGAKPIFVGVIGYAALVVLGVAISFLI